MYNYLPEIIGRVWKSITYVRSAIIWAVPQFLLLIVEFGTTCAYTKINDVRI